MHLGGGHSQGPANAPFSSAPERPHSPHPSADSGSTWPELSKLKLSVPNDKDPDDISTCVASRLKDWKHSVALTYAMESLNFCSFQKRMPRGHGRGSSWGLRRTCAVGGHELPVKPPSHALSRLFFTKLKETDTVNNPHHREEETEAQRRYLTCPGSHS